MKNETITVLARLKAKAGKEEETRQMLLSLVAPSRADAGCIGYDLHQAIDDPSVFVFYENWQSREALDQHLGTRHLKTLLDRSEELLAEPIQIILLNKIS